MGWQECPSSHRWKSKFHPHPSELFCKECGERAMPTLRAKTGGSGLKAAPATPLEREAHDRFTALVTEWPCFFSDRVDSKPRRPGHKCWGRIDPHHLVPVDYMVKQLGLGPEIAYDPILGVPLCRLAHEAVERRTDFVYWNELDPECIDFCRRHGLLPRLEIESPNRTKASAA